MKRSDWNALSRHAAALQAAGHLVTLVVGREPDTEVIETSEFGAQARCVSADDYDGFEGCIASDGTRHPLGA